MDNLLAQPRQTNQAPPQPQPNAPPSAHPVSAMGMMRPRRYEEGTSGVAPFQALRAAQPQPPQLGMPSADPSQTPVVNAIRSFVGGQVQREQQSPVSASIPNAFMNYFVRPENAQVVQQPGMPVGQPSAGTLPTASGLTNNAAAALSRAVWGPRFVAPMPTPSGPSPTPSGPSPTPSGPSAPSQLPHEDAGPGVTEPINLGYINNINSHLGGPSVKQIAGSYEAYDPGAGGVGVVPAGRGMAPGSAQSAFPAYPNPGDFLNMMRGKTLDEIKVLMGLQHYDPHAEAFQHLLAIDKSLQQRKAKAENPNKPFVYDPRDLMEMYTGSAPYSKYYRGPPAADGQY